MTKQTAGSPEVFGEMVVFAVRELRCALPLSQLQEIIRLPAITPVRVGIPELRGVINLRGEIVTVIDLGVSLGFAPQRITRDSRIVVVKHGEELIGLLVDRVDDTTTAQADDVFPPPGNLHGVHGAMFRAVLRTEAELIAVLDLGRALFRGEAA